MVKVPDVGEIKNALVDPDHPLLISVAAEQDSLSLTPNFAAPASGEKPVGVLYLEKPEVDLPHCLRGVEKCCAVRAQSE